MHRRTLLKGLLLGSAVVGSPAAVASPSRSILGAIIHQTTLDEEDEYLIHEKNLQSPVSKDVVLSGRQFDLLKSVASRLKRVKTEVGYANFSLIGVDQALLYARRYPIIGEFTLEEKAFLEEMFYADAKNYGFLGAKVSNDMTSKINKREIKKIPRTGNYLFRESSLAFYETIRNDVGDSIILTSGVRGVVKQMYLFLTKAVHSGGNLSLASRSIAPPGYSFHGNGDFDVGKVGFGHRNFTDAFSKTTEYQRLQDLGYVQMRYPKKNPFGVRFEPWHIKVNTRT